MGLICGFRCNSISLMKLDPLWVWYICVKNYKVFLVDNEYGVSLTLLTSFGVKSILLDITTPASGSV